MWIRPTSLAGSFYCTLEKLTRWTYLAILSLLVPVPWAEPMSIMCWETTSMGTVIIWPTTEAQRPPAKERTTEPWTSNCVDMRCRTPSYVLM